MIVPDVGFAVLELGLQVLQQNGFLQPDGRRQAGGEDQLAFGDEGGIGHGGVSLFYGWDSIPINGAQCAPYARIAFTRM